MIWPFAIFVKSYIIQIFFHIGTYNEYSLKHCELNHMLNEFCKTL